MNKLLRFSFLLLLTLVSSFAMADAYKTLTFPDENNANNHVGAYTKSWVATIGEDSWDIANFNNNNWNSWTYIKCGNKTAASVCTITNTKPYAAKISSVVVTIDKITAASINDIYLVVATDSACKEVVETVKAASIAAGDMKLDVKTPTADCYYQLVFDCAKGGSNGLVQVSKVEYYEDGAAGPTITDISNTPEEAYSVSKAKELIAAGEGLATSVYVKGTICSIQEISTQFGNATYSLVEGADTLVIFRGLGLENAKFESEDALHVGDEVIVYGQLIDYKGTDEMAQGNYIYSLTCNYVAPVNLTATYASGKVTLTYADYALGAIEAGKGTIEVWNEVQKVAELVNGEYGIEYNELVYSLSASLEPGTYTVKVPEGAVKGNATDAFGAMTAIAAAQANFDVTAAGPQDTMLGEASFELLTATGVNVKYTYPDSQEGMNEKQNAAVTAVLYEDSVQVATADFGFQMEPTYFFGVHFDYTTVEGKTYKVVFPAGAWAIVDGETGATLESSPEAEYTWVAGANAGPTGGNDGDGWKFASVTPAEGKVESLHDLTFGYPSGCSYVNESVTFEVQCPNGKVAKMMLYDNFSGACAGVVVDETLSADGTYTLEIPAGSFTSSNGEPCAAMTYTWTIGEDSIGNNEDAFVFAYDKAGEKLSLTWPGAQQIAATFLGGAYIDGYDGNVTFNVSSSNESDPLASIFGPFDQLATFIVLPDGEYTLHITAGTYTIDGVENEEISYKFTVGEGSNTGGGNTGNFDGDKWQEVIFESGVTEVKVPVTFDTKGVSIATEGREFFNGVSTETIDVKYNIQGEKEIDWLTGTKLVITAKDNISGIVMDGQFLQYASADKGTYNNGAWSGALNKGETLTLTSTDGVYINKLVVLYNGAELEKEDDGPAEVTTTFNITKTSWATIGNMAGEVIGTVTTDAEPFDHYMFEIRCDEDESQYISFNDLLTKEGDIVCTSPTSAGHDLFNGQHYTLTAYVYSSPQYGAVAVDTVVYTFVGEGKEPTIYSNDTIAKVNLPVSTDGLCDYICDGLSFDVTFSAPISSVSAVSPQGMEGSTKLTATKKSEDGKVWTITMPESLKNGSSETELPIANVDIVAYDANGNVLKTANPNHPYAIKVGLYEQEKPSAGAVLVIGENEIALSTETSAEVGELPEGAVFKYTVTQADTKNVTFEIYDVTANSSLKSVTSQSNSEGLAGVVEFPLALKYELAKGHAYVARFKEYSTMSTLNKTPTASADYKLAGTADVAVYSTVSVVSITPSESTFITSADQRITITFSEPIASLSVKAILGQMASVNVAASDIVADSLKQSWTVSLNDNYCSDGALSLNFYAIDNEGNRVTDPKAGVGTPESCYLNYDWATTIGLPTPTLVQNGKSYETVSTLNFMYEGIGINQDKTTATWNKIVITKDSVPMNIAITEDMFKVLGDESVGGSQLNLTLPTLYKGVYTVTVPACAFMLGHDNANFYSGDCTFTFTCTAAAPEPELAVNITKTSWATIGDQNGEVIGTVTLNNSEFDHIEAEIRCAEDPDQYITFANINTNGGNLACFAWEGGHYDLNKGYHYTITIKGFDVPYYGAKPVATATYDFVGTGVEAAKYCDIALDSVYLKSNDLLVDGYDINGTSFDVQFSAPVSKVKTWIASGFDGAQIISAEKKSEDGKIWTIILPESSLTEEGSINVMIQAWNAEGVMAKGVNGDHAFALNIFVSNSDPDGIDAITLKSKNNGKYILNGKVVIVKNGVLYNMNGSIIK